jgi:hypothetical protein
MDLVELGRQLLERKLELTGEAAEMGDMERPPPQSRTRRGGRDMRARSS